MKKFLRILLITIGTIFILLITLPILFKSKIETFVKDQINQNVHATVDWSRFGISMIRGFPDLSINLHQVSVVGVEPFEGDTLVGLKRFEFRVNPFSALRRNLQVKSIFLDRPLINGIVLEDGTANWDIAPETEIESGDMKELEEKESETSMGLTLQRFAISEGRVYYKDESTDVDVSMEGFNLELTGDFSMDQTEATLKLMIGRINAKYGGIRYMKDGSFGLDMVAAANMIDNVYTLRKNQITLNGLVLGAEGVVALMEDGGMEMDLRFFSRETSFHTILSMVPAIYLKEFETLKTSGNLKLDGSVTGIMKDSILPDVKLYLVVADGYFAYPDLPKDVSDVQIRLNVDYRGADMDKTTVDLDEFHMLLGGNPFDMNLHVANPISDMHVSGKAVGMIDFASLQDVVPLEEVNLEGRLKTDLSWDTRMSYIEQEQFEKVDLAGSFVIEKVRLNAPDIPVEVQLKKMELNFTPRIVDLVTLDLMLGSSDVHMDGTLTNFIPYVFDDQTISGSLNISSGLLDVNELLPELEEDSIAEQAVAGESEALVSEMSADSIAEPARVKIPENIDFSMALDLKKVIYDQIMLENILGKMIVRDGVANLEQLKMDIIEGSVTTTGKVDTRGEFPEVDVSLDMKGVDIPSSYEAFVTVERLAPMAKYCKGIANVKMQYHSLLDASFSPIYQSIDAKGRLFTNGLRLYNTNSFVRLSELLKNEKFREMTPDEVDVRFTIRDGRVMVDPFDMDFEDSKITVSGSHGIDQTMDYLLDMTIAMSDLGTGVNELMSGITALAAGAGFQVPQSDHVKVKARITGTFNDPKVTTDFSEILKSTGESVKVTVKEKVAEEVEKVEEQVRDQASEKAEKMISDAEAEAERLVEKAQKAGDDLVKEAEIQGENLIKEAGSNPFKQIAAKKAAEELKRQAQKQSDNLVGEAEVKADEIIDKAREEAAKI